MLPRLVFPLQNLAKNTPKQNVLNMIKSKFDFRFKKGVAVKPLKRERQETINCHYPDISWKFKISLPVKISHKFSPLFNRFSTFDKNVNLSKANPEAENPFLDLPLAKYLDFFYDVSKNSEHINTFRGARLKSHPSKFQSLTF
jgi:hypothetical protein